MEVSGTSASGRARQPLVDERGELPLRAAVTIFETHNVIELGGTGLEDDRFL
jgi:hypothetical protein